MQEGYYNCDALPFLLLQLFWLSSEKGYHHLEKLTHFSHYYTIKNHEILLINRGLEVNCSKLHIIFPVKCGWARIRIGLYWTSISRISWSNTSYLSVGFRIPQYIPSLSFLNILKYIAVLNRITVQF